MAGVLCRSLVMIKNNDNDDYDADCDVLNCIMSLLCKWIVSVCVMALHAVSMYVILHSTCTYDSCCISSLVLSE